MIFASTFRRCRTGLFALALLSGNAIVASADFDPATWPDDKIIPPRDALKGTLPNGVRYAIEHQSADANKDKAQVNLLVQVGSLHEKPEEAGYAHFLEHLLITRGSYKEKSEAFLESMNVPSALHGQSGFTRLDATFYGIPVPEKARKNVPGAIELLAGRLLNADFTDDEVDLEREVVLSEEQTRRQTDAEKRRIKVLFGETHPLTTQLPIGTRKTLGTATRDSLMAFYENWYRPERLIVTVAGDIKPKAVLRQIRKHFGKIPKRTTTVTEPEIIEPQPGIRVDVIEDPEIDLISTQALLLNPYPDLTTIPDLRRALAEAIALNITSDRLRDFVNDRGDINVMGVFFSNMENIGGIEIQAVGQPGTELESFANTTRILETALREGFSKTDVDVAATIRERSYLSRLDAEGHRPNEQIAMHWANALNDGYHAFDTEAEVKAAQHVLKQITPAEAQAALLRLVRSNSIGFVINVPEGQTLKEPPTAFGAAIASLQSVPDVDMTRDAEEKAASTEKDAFALVDIQPGAITSREHHKGYGIILKLSNGATVLFRQEDEPGKPFRIQYQAPGGAGVLNGANAVNTQVAREAVFNTGLRGLRSSALANLFRLHNTTADLAIQEGQLIAVVSSITRETDFAMRAFHIMMTEAEMDDASYTLVKEKFKTAMEAREKDEQYRFNAALREALWPDHPFNPDANNLETLSEVTPEWIHSMMERLFAHVSGGYFLISGSVTEEDVTPLIEMYLASLPAGDPWSRPVLDYPSAIEATNVRHFDNPNERSLGQMFFIEDSPEYDDRQRAVRFAFSGLLSKILLDDIREAQGLVYSIGAQASSPGVITPVHGLVSIGYVADPSHVETIETSVMGHIKDLANMSDEDTETLALIQAQSKRQFTDSLKRPAATLAYLMNAQMIGQPVLTEQRAHDYIDSVTPADVRVFAQQVLEEFVNVNAEFSPPRSED